MSADRLSEDQFNRMLSQALQRRSEPVPAGFTGMVLDQVRQLDEHRILSRVILQERLALAACIGLVVAVIVAATVFPDAAVGAFRSVAAGLTQRAEGLIDTIPQAVKTLTGQWRLFTVLGAVFGFTIYSFAELLLGDKIRIRMA